MTELKYNCFYIELLFVRVLLYYNMKKNIFIYTRIFLVIKENYFYERTLLYKNEYVLYIK